MRTFLLLLCFTSLIEIHAQNKSGTAKVNVFVTDGRGKPSRGEEILFRAETTQKTVNGVADPSGHFSIDLPVGDKYTIKVKSITDTAKYGTLVIPPLAPDESYSEPFKVNIKFEPARTYTLNNVHFDFGKATLRPDSYNQLEELVGYLKNKPDVRVEIAGHTDNIGADADNLKLSQQRAETIRQYVIKKGVAAARISAKGYGASQPAADNDTDEGRQLNRRTEVRIL